MKLAYGIHRNLSREDYDKLTGLNFSKLKWLDKSPLEYRHNSDNPPEQTDPMRIGNAAHLAMLEPDLAKFAIWTGGRRYGNKWDDFKDAHSHLTILNEEERDYVCGMKAAVQSHPVAWKYLRHAETEVSAFWRDPVFKRDMKARIDAWTDIGEDTYFVSLKTTVDVSERKFSRQYVDMLYYVQDAHYQNGYFYLNHCLPKKVTIAVEKEPPHEVAVYQIGEDITRLGAQKIGEWIQKLERCEKSGKWPGAVETETQLVLPNWCYPHDDFDLSELIER